MIRWVLFFVLACSAAFAFQVEKPVPYRAADFNASEYLTYSHADTGHVSVQFSAYMRFALASSGANRVLSSKTASFNVNNGRNYAIAVLSGGTVLVYAFNTRCSPFCSNYIMSFVSTNTVDDGSCHDLLVNFDLNNSTASNRILVWIDGASETASSSNLAGTGLRQSTSDLSVGALPNGALPWNGIIYQHAISNDSVNWSTSDVRESSGAPKDLRTLTSLRTYHTILDGNITYDHVLGDVITNVNSTADVDPADCDDII